jgi:uncharacterized membrane protein YgcG
MFHLMPYDIVSRIARHGVPPPSSSLNRYNIQGEKPIFSGKACWMLCCGPRQEAAPIYLRSGCMGYTTRLVYLALMSWLRAQYAARLSERDASRKRAAAAAAAKPEESGFDWCIDDASAAASQSGGAGSALFGGDDGDAFSSVSQSGGASSAGGGGGASAASGAGHSGARQPAHKRRRDEGPPEAPGDGDE